MRFTKMQGVGNDFVVLDAADLPADADLPALAVRLCHREFGVGADGLLVVSQTPLTMWMFNPDGTEDVCGNGMRCVGLWAWRTGWVTPGKKFNLHVADGPRAVRLIEVGKDGKTGTLTVDMGLPKFAPEDIPMCGNENSLRVENRTFPITSVNTGSTHTVIFCDELPDEATFLHFSPLIENHPCFPERTSVLWATPGSRPFFINVRIWERGVGETLGCGTGACAVGVAARLNGLTDFVTHVASKGGALSIVWTGDDAAIRMSGPAAFVFDGDFPL